MINRIIPHRNPKVTWKVCRPWKVPSRETSRHHWYIIIEFTNSPKISKFGLLKWNHLRIPISIVKVPKELKRGQGLGSTR